MKIIQIRVEGQTAELQTNIKEQKIVRGTDNFLRLSFSLGADWRNRSKVIHMEDVEGNSYNCVLNQFNAVMIPKEVTGTSRIYITLYGRNGSETIRTNTITIEQL